MFPWLSFSTCSAASPCARLSRAPSTTSGSDFHHDIGLLVDGPFGRPTRLLTGQDRGGSPRFRDTSFSVRAVLSDPARVSDSLARRGSLLLPSKFSTLSASGLSSNEAQSLHLRYGLDIARSTLSPCRCLHEPKTRFLVGRLVPLARTGVSPVGSARFILAHRKSQQCLRPKCSSPSSLGARRTTHPAHCAACVPGESHRRIPENPLRKSG
jgi:hypothetical protein